jgi:hypothetical protein
MNDQTNIERLIEAATKYGYTQEQITLICTEISEAAYAQFSQEVEMLLSPEERHSINSVEGTDRVRIEIERFYKEKTGIDAVDRVGGYLSSHIDEFIKDHSGDVLSTISA